MSTKTPRSFAARFRASRLLNAERERSAEIGEGIPRAERELQMEPRSEPQTPNTT